MTNRRRKADSTDLKIRIVGAFMFALFAIAVARAVVLQVYRAETLQARAADQYAKKIKILPSRGKIYDRNMQELAASVAGSSAYVTGERILEDPEQFDRITKALSLDKYAVSSLIRKRGGMYTTIKRRLTPAEEIAAAEIAKNSKYFGVAPQPARYYPNKYLAGQILGYVGQDGEGLGGLEYKYEETLKGNPVWVYAERDAKAAGLMTEAPDMAQGRGKSLVLTIDQSIQHIVEEELELAVTEREAKGAFSVILDPTTGEILALAQVPRLNPNDFTGARAEERKIKTITDVFEPGSTMKPVFISIMLESGAARPTDTVYCENGKWKVYGGKVIHDHSGHGVMGLPDIIKVSSNIGVAKLSQRISYKAYYDGLYAYGFGRESGIDLRGESKGILPPTSSWAKITPMTVAYGQGIAVTPVQMVNAYAALANGGVMMKPHLVKAVLDENGGEIERIEPKELGRPVSRANADMVMRWMELVVMDPGGTATSADGSGYTVAGKTGTAWKPSKGGYDTRRVVASFIGAAPSRSPRIVALVALDEPTKGSTYGGVVAAPVFKNIARRVLTHLSVPPDRPVTVAQKNKKDGADKKKKEAEAKASKILEDSPDGFEDEATDVVEQRNSMPDLSGLTMREAVKRLEQTGIAFKLDLRGSGFASAQEPAAGTSLTDGTLCVVHFDSPLNLASTD